MSDIIKLLKSRKEIPKPIASWNFTDFSKLQPGAGANDVEVWTGASLKAGIATIDLEQLIPAAQPLFNTDRIEFDGSDFLEEKSGLSVGNGDTIFFKMKSVAVGVNFARIISTKLTFGDALGFEITVEGMTNDSITIIGAGGVFNSVTVDNFVTGEPVIAVVLNGSSVAIYSDSVFKGNAAINAITASANPLVVGSRSSGADPFEGDMFKMSIYPTLLDADEIALISASLA